MIKIKSRIIDALYRHAIAEFPSECCGVVMGKKGDPNSFEQSFPCRNLQNQKHTEDSQNFPRTAETAYFLDPQDLFRIQKLSREKGMEMKVIYHSHVNVGAYFSAEDKKQAAYEGNPIYPGVYYLVIDVTKDSVRGAKLFEWDPTKKDFSEISWQTV